MHFVQSMLEAMLERGDLFCKHRAKLTFLQVLQEPFLIVLPPGIVIATFVPTADI